MGKKSRRYGSDEPKAQARSGSDMTKFYWILGAVAVIGIGVVGYSVGSNAMGNTVAAPVEVEGLDDPARLVELAQGVVKGDPDAPITIVEFGDYMCPGCAAFAQQVKPMVEAEFVAPGTAKFVFYDFPLVSIHPNSFLAARAARCAEDQGRFWEYHDHLFANQPRWSTASNPAGTLVDYSEDLGLDRDAFETCLRSDRHADVVTANMQLGNELQVPGTPTVLVSQGRGVGLRVASNVDAIREAVRGFQATAP